jgi:hypothetical protein
MSIIRRNLTSIAMAGVALSILMRWEYIGLGLFVILVYAAIKDKSHRIS